jgi:hypothetical protein
MNFIIHYPDNPLTAELNSKEALISTVDNVPDLLGNASYLGTTAIVFRESNKAGHVVFVSSLEEVKANSKNNYLYLCVSWQLFK